MINDSYKQIGHKDIKQADLLLKLASDLLQTVNLK
jgi:hypothetical protein